MLYEEQKCIRKERNETGWGEVAQKVGRRVTDEAVWACWKIAPDSVVAVPYVTRQVQTGPEEGGVSLVSVTAGPNKNSACKNRPNKNRPKKQLSSTGKDYPRQSGGRLDSSIVWADSAKQDVDKPSTPEKTKTPPDRTADMIDSATTGQYSSGKDSNWSDSDLTSNGSAS